MHVRYRLTDLCTQCKIRHLFRYRFLRSIDQCFVHGMLYGLSDRELLHTCEPPRSRKFDRARHAPMRRARLEEAARRVRAGTPLADALEEQAVLTPSGYNLVRVGERSGELPSMLRSPGRLCEDAGRVRMKQFLALLEPAAILVIGGVIGVIMIGIILAITSANDIAV